MADDHEAERVGGLVGIRGAEALDSVQQLLAIYRAAGGEDARELVAVEILDLTDRLLEIVIELAVTNSDPDAIRWLARNRNLGKKTAPGTEKQKTNPETIEAVLGDQWKEAVDNNARIARSGKRALWTKFAVEIRGRAERWRFFNAGRAFPSEDSGGTPMVYVPPEDSWRDALREMAGIARQYGVGEPPALPLPGKFHANGTPEDLVDEILLPWFQQMTASEKRRLDFEGGKYLRYSTQEGVGKEGRTRLLSAVSC